LILCIDIGNSKVKCALGEVLSYSQAAVATDKIECSADFEKFICESFGSDVLARIDRCSIASVVPAKNEIISQVMLEHSVAIRRIDRENCSVDFSRYSSGLGEDRSICCAAAAAKYPLPLIIIDFGTATTINVVDCDRKFMGGAIAAGIYTGLKALMNRTAQLPPISEIADAKLIGENTNEGLVSGAVIGAACMALGYVTKITKQLGKEPTVVVTGGNAERVVEHLQFEFVYERQLLIDGLFGLWE